MKKKILSMLLMSAVALGMAGCSGTETSVTTTVGDVTTTITNETATSETTATTEESTDDDISILTENNLLSNDVAIISETVIVDEAGIKITAKELKDGIWGTELKVLIENNSGKDLTIQCRNTSINGYMVENMLSADVTNGKKVNDSITFMSSDFKKCGIEQIADMEFSFYIFDSESWDTYLETDLIQITTSISDSYEYKFDDNGNLLYDNDGIRIIEKGLSEDSFFGLGVTVYIENLTENNITVQTKDVAVNGFMVDPVFSCDVSANKRAVSEITFFESDFEENGITDIENLELSFHIFNTDNWNDIANTDAITLNF